MMGREQYGEGEEQFVIYIIPDRSSNMLGAVLWYGNVWLSVELGDWYFLM